MGIFDEVFFLLLLSSFSVVPAKSLKVTTSDVNSRHRRDTISEEHKKWPGGIVPYIYGYTAGYLEKTVFQEAIKEIEKFSCVKFVKRTRERDYVRLVSGEGCYSIVGRDGGRQDLSIGQGCRTKGIAMHELLHTLGFFHEQSRPDRDKHVTINHNNAIEDAKRQFKKYKPEEGDTRGEPYDPDSIMHYANNAFSKNGRNTIVYKRDPYKLLGQRERMSNIDIRQLRKLYRCTGGNSTKNITTTEKPAVEIDTCRDYPSTPGSCFFSQMTGMCTFAAQRMVHTCRKTCRFCRQTCFDTSLHCGYFSLHGYCERSKTVQRRCRKTCGFCRIA